MNNTEFEQLCTQYLDKVDERQSTLANLNQKKSHKTILPKQIEDYQTYISLHEIIKDEQGEIYLLQERIKILDDQIKSLTTKLVNALPSRTWIRVKINNEDLGIGFYYDAWGGDHPVIKTVPWEPELPRLKDIRHYD